MEVHAALEQIARWCAGQTAIGEPNELEVERHAILYVTIGENAPPWDVRWERHCSSGASSPVAQLRYEPETREWSLHHLTRAGWCCDEEAVRAGQIAPLLAEIASDREGRFQGLPRGFRWPLASE